MVLCEHFIFTSADLKEKSGYQVVSKSSKISPKLLEKLEDYLYPSGLEPSEFSECTSTVILDNKVAFTKSKNVGIGFDGRSDTIYCHTIIAEMADFKKLHYDSRIFNDYFLFSKEEKKYLAPIVIESKKIIPDFSCIDILGIAQFEDFFGAIFSKKKIAILNIERKNLIQSLISLLPPTFRSISFSTLVVQPERQSKFELIQTNSSKSSLKHYFVIDPKEREQISSAKDTLFDQCIRYLLDVIDSKNTHKLTEIYDKFENIIHENHVEKISLIIGTMLLDSKQHLLSKKYAQELLSILDKMPLPVITEYFPKIQTVFDENEVRDYVIKYEALTIISKFDSNELDANILGTILGERSDGSTESRNSLFHNLIDERLNDFQKNGAQILENVLKQYFHKDMIRGFLEEPRLHNSFSQVFDKNYEIEKTQKQDLFSFTIKNALRYNSNFLEKLFSFDVYNLEEDDDVKQFKDIVKWLFSAREFHQYIEPSIILNVSKSIYDKIDPIFPRNKKSGTMENGLYDLQEIFITILNTLRYLLGVRKFELTSNYNEIKDFESNLSYFHHLNELPMKSIYDLIPSSDIGKLVSSMGSWILFATFHNRL